jgi:hypothetical protein
MTLDTLTLTSCDVCGETLSRGVCIVRCDRSDHEHGSLEEARECWHDAPPVLRADGSPSAFTVWMLSGERDPFLIATGADDD